MGEGCGPRASWATSSASSTSRRKGATMSHRRSHRFESLALAVAVLMFCLLALLWSSRAHADVPQFSTGPSVSFFRFGFKLNDPTKPAAGDKAGVDLLSARAGWPLTSNPPPPPPAPPPHLT